MTFEQTERRAVNRPLPIGVRAGQQAGTPRRGRAPGSPPRGKDGRHPAVAPRRRVLSRPVPCRLRSALVLGLTLLSACTVRLELAEHRFAEGDLAAASMGLAAHQRWFDPQSVEVVPAAAPREPGPAAVLHAERTPGTARSAMRLVTRTHHLALAGPDSPARLTAALSSRASIAPALGASETRSAAHTAADPRLVTGNPTSAPRSPAKP